MVKKRFSRKYRPRRRYRKKTPKSLKYQNTELTVGGPYRIFRKLRYVDPLISLDPSTLGERDVHVYSLNGLYDPDITGTGNQPRSFDQYMAMYKHYVVLGARITVKFIPGGAMSANGRVGIAIRPNTALATDPVDYLENNSRIRSAFLSPNATDEMTMTLTWSAKHWFGKKGVLEEKDLEGTSGTNPSNQAYLHVWADGLGSDIGAIRCMVKIEYITCFREPDNPAQS